MPLVEELPNVEAAVNAVLDEAGLRVYSSIPGRSPTYPLIVTMRLGGAPAEKHVLDAPRIQLEAWGMKSTKKNAVLDYARDAWKALLEAEGEIVELANGEAVMLTSVNPEIGLQWLPDPATARPRYVASLRVYARSVVRAS